MKRYLGLALIAILTSCGMLAQFWTAPPPTLDARDLDALEIFAYRDWQGTSVQLEQGQRVIIRARGEWLYTPNEWNGPEGHRRYSSPSFYPLPGVPGGALIGKIGESGQIFYAGAYTNFSAPTAGQLFLRIDDDILSDNEGKVQVTIQAEEKPRAENQDKP